MSRKNHNGASSNFPTMLQTDVPQGRNGKHKNIVTKILADLEQLTANRAVRVPLEDLGDTKENVRAALNRATRKRDLKVATAADGCFLYVWRKDDDR